MTLKCFNIIQCRQPNLLYESKSGIYRILLIKQLITSDFGLHISLTTFCSDGEVSKTSESSSKIFNFKYVLDLAKHEALTRRYDITPEGSKVDPSLHC